MTYWSGAAVWINDKLRYVGKKPLIEEVEPQAKKKTTKRDSAENVDTAHVSGAADSENVNPNTNTLDASSAQGQKWPE